MKQAAVVLAAGGGARYAASGGDGHKLLAELRGRAVVTWAVGHAMEAALDGVFVVVGSIEVPAVAGAQVVRNTRWTEGMATSLQAGIRAAASAGHDAVVVGLGDQPLVEPEAWRRVGRSLSPIAVASYDGVRGHPVRLAADVWPLLPAAGDRGAGPLMENRPELVAEVPCPGCPADVDTVEDLLRWS